VWVPTVLTYVTPRKSQASNYCSLQTAKGKEKQKGIRFCYDAKELSQGRNILLPTAVAHFSFLQRSLIDKQNAR
jgi:hypothetical protein